jgi:hypothetical protein
VLGDRGEYDLWLSIECDNLLDEDIRNPEYACREINTLLPLRGGRSFLIRIGYEL